MPHHAAQLTPRGIAGYLPLVVLGSLLFTTPARAELRVGTGVASEEDGPAWSVSVVSTMPAREPQGLVFARLEGEIHISPGASYTVPFLELALAPAEFQVVSTEFERRYSAIDLFDRYEYRALPLVFARDVQLGRQFEFQLYLLGMNRVRVLSLGETNIPFFRIQLRLVGYHRISFLDETAPFNGIELADVLAQAGLARRLTPGWLAILSGALEIETSLRPRRGQMIEAKIEPTVRFQLKYRRYLALYLEARSALAHDPSVEDTFRSVSRVGGGLVLRFR